MNILDAFRSKPVPAPESMPEPTENEIRQQREAELKRQLQKLDAEEECLSEKMRAFRLVHCVLLGGRVMLCGRDAMNAEQLKLEWESYLHDLTMLQQNRNTILSEWSRLIRNPNESTHIEGKQVTHVSH